MDSTRKNFVPFALLMAIIYEDEDEEVQNIANHIVRRNARFRGMNENLDTKEFTVRAISLKASFPSSEVKEAVIVGGDFQVQLRLINMVIENVSDFITKKKKKCCLNFDFDHVNMSAQYEIEGKIAGKPIRSDGNTEIVMKEVTGDVQVEYNLKDNIAQITNLRLDYNFKNLEFGETGLVVRDTPKNDIKRILNSVGKLYFKQNVKAVSSMLAETIRDRFNAILQGKDRSEILTLLRRETFEI